MLFITVPHGLSYRVVNPFKASDRALLDTATTVTVRIFGADKSPVIAEATKRLIHFTYAFGYEVITSEVLDSQEFSITLHNLLPGTGFYWAVILARFAGRQKIKAAELTYYATFSETRKQLVKQLCPSTCDGGSDLRDATKEVLEASQGYLDQIAPLFEAYGLHRRGSFQKV